MQKWIAGDDDFEAAEKRSKEAVVRRPKIVEVAEAVVGHGWLQQNGNLD